MWQGEFLSKEIKEIQVYNLNKVGFLPIQDLVQIIENAELVICNRYHAFVLAISRGVPAINLIKKVCGDYRYYFNKNYGLLEYTFENMVFNEIDFLKIDMLETLENVENNLFKIIEKQKILFNSQQYKENKKQLKKLRENYIKQIFEKI